MHEAVNQIPLAAFACDALTAIEVAFHRAQSFLRSLGFSKAAEGKGLEPSTPCGATDFESVSSPFGYPPGSVHIYPARATVASATGRFPGRRRGLSTVAGRAIQYGAPLIA